MSGDATTPNKGAETTCGDGRHALLPACPAPALPRVSRWSMGLTRAGREGGSSVGKDPRLRDWAPCSSEVLKASLSLPATVDQAAASFEMEMSQTGFSAHYSQVCLPAVSSFLLPRK